MPLFHHAKGFLGSCCWFVCLSALAADSLDNLVGDSPFLSKAGVGTLGGPLDYELRGIIDVGSNVTVGIYDRTTNLNYWLPVTPGADPSAGDNGAPFTVQAYDAKQEWVQIASHGRTLKIGLSKAIIGVSMPTGDDFTAASPALAIQGPVNSGPGSDVSIADLIAGEVQRRNGLRQILGAPQFKQPLTQ
jgi:hypothetical protein